ncbi:MAG: topoisomerase C-terminal repeat-containing protein [Deltaproteobacteria bacterium]|nr:topoisomerase C-terminal repeat-containing protein [Deltaproteobacteria bacterium]
MAKALLKDRKTAPVKGFRAKTGKTFTAALALDDEGKVRFEFPEPGLGRLPAVPKPVQDRGQGLLLRHRPRVQLRPVQRDERAQRHRGRGPGLALHGPNRAHRRSQGPRRQGLLRRPALRRPEGARRGHG